MTQDEIDILWADLGVFAGRLRAERSEHHFTSTQLQTLGHLDRDGSTTAKNLAELEGVTPQSIAKTVIILENRGMVTRRSDPSDGRANLIDLTELGTTALRDDRTLRNRWLAAAIHTECTEAERDLLRIAGKILRRLGQSTPLPTQSDTRRKGRRGTDDPAHKPDLQAPL